MAESKKAITALPLGKESWQLILQKISRDKIVFVALIVLIALYVMVAFADFLAPYSEQHSDRHLANSAPTPVYVIDGESGGLAWPYVFKYKRGFDSSTFEFTYEPIDDTQYPLKFFVHDDEGQLRLFGVDPPAQVALLGTDMNGRDNFSRLLYGGQISLTVGFLGLFIAFPIGLIYGGLSGYFGGWLDNLMMRFAEIIMSIPSFYLLISLAAILPANLSSSTRFALVVVILAFIGWAGLSRVIRGMVLSIKSQEFVEAERAIGVSSWGIVVRHILPQTASYVIIAVTMGVPGYILAESGLSFLGLGIQQPDASWGNMLKEAQEITNIVGRPWMLMPGFLIFLAVLAFNVIGDALRDVLDPKSYIRK